MRSLETIRSMPSSTQPARKRASQEQKIEGAKLVEYPTVREALLYQRLSDGKVQCGLCERRCLVLAGKRGFCKARMNIEGILYTLVYGDISALESRPIEIKPFFHYWPGSTALTFSTWSCNFRCPWCQNHALSRKIPDPSRANYMPAQDVVELAARSGNQGLCVSFTEPTMLFDYALDVFAMSRKRGLYNCYVSNGYLTSEALQMLARAGLDAIKIDIKGDAEVYQNYCGGLDVETVWRNIATARRIGLHVEVVNLVITDVNDDENCLNWVIEKHLEAAGKDAPLHFTRYHPAHKFSNAPTDVWILEKAYKMALRRGVRYPYLGNVLGHKCENTYCPSCKEMLVRRFEYCIVDYRITRDKRCLSCGEPIPIAGQFISPY